MAAVVVLVVVLVLVLAMAVVQLLLVWKDQRGKENMLMAMKAHEL